jgi:hypothetical protein
MQVYLERPRLCYEDKKLSFNFRITFGIYCTFLMKIKQNRMCYIIYLKKWTMLYLSVVIFIILSTFLSEPRVT